MCNFKETLLDSQNEENGEGPYTSTRKVFKISDRRCPRRYVIVIMLFLLLLLRYWRALNIDFKLSEIFLGEDCYVRNTVISNWKFSKLEYYILTDNMICLLSQIPGALLIFKFSSYKFLLFSTVVCSFLHILTPMVESLNFISLLIALFSQTLFEAPLYIGVTTMLKDWSPPMEKCTLMGFIVLGKFIGYTSPAFCSTQCAWRFSPDFCMAGIAGLIWAVFWYNMVWETPEKDPLISESELFNLECDLLPKNNQNQRLKEIPWKSIMKTKPMFVLCLIFIKVCISGWVITNGVLIFSAELENNVLFVFIPFLIAYLIVIPFSSVSADNLMKSMSEDTMFIRKFFVCGSFFLQFCFMFGIAYTSSPLSNAIFLLLSYLMYVASFPGFFTLVLELSPKYVAIVSGILYTSFYTGNMCTHIILFLLMPNESEQKSLNRLMILDIILTFGLVRFFYKWGDDDDDEECEEIVSEKAEHQAEEKNSPDTEQHDKKETFQETTNKEIFSKKSVSEDNYYVCHI